MTRHTEPPAWSAAIAVLSVTIERLQATIDDQALTIEEKDGIIADQARQLDETDALETRLLSDKEYYRENHEWWLGKCGEFEAEITNLRSERETLRARIRELTDRLDGTDAATECEEWSPI